MKLSVEGRQTRDRQLDVMKGDLENVGEEIAALIGKIEGLREDLYGEDPK